MFIGRYSNSPPANENNCVDSVKFICSAETLFVDLVFLRFRGVSVFETRSYRESLLCARFV